MAFVLDLFKGQIKETFLVSRRLFNKMAAFMELKNFLQSYQQISEEEINFQSFLNFPLYWFRFLMFDFKPLSLDATMKEKLVHIARATYVKISLICLSIACVLMTAFTIVNSDDFVVSSRSVPNFVTMTLIGLKTYSTFLRKDAIWNVLQELKVIYEQVCANGNFKAKKYLEGYYFYVRMYAGTFLVLMVPIAFPVILFLHNGKMELSVTYWFPFDVFRPTIFPAVLVWTNFIAWSGTFYLLGCDSILYALITLISMEFDATNIELINICYVTKSQRAMAMTSVIDRQNKLLELSDKLQNIYGLTFFFSFFISSIILCFVVFQLSIASENILSTYSFFVPYLGIVVGQILLLCVYGQKLIESSGSLGDGAYNCGWESFDDVALKKQLILIIMKARKAQSFSAMGFADISLPSFTTVRINFL